jgi:hypothetical protein
MEDWYMHDDQPTGERRAHAAQSRDLASQRSVSISQGGRALLRLAVLLVLPLVLVGCLHQEDREGATEREVVPETTPTALADLPQGIEAAELVVEDGDFAVEELNLLAGEPTDLRVANRDSRAYRLQIEDLVVATPIAANATSEVEFTTPNPGEFEGQLLAEEEDEVLDTLRVVVRSAGEVP